MLETVAAGLDATGRVTNNESSVRRVVAIALALAVQGAALTSPLVHAHPDEHATGHHAGREVHTHWAGHDQSHHSPDAPAFDRADQDRAVFLNTFVAVAVPAFPAPVLTPAVIELPVPAERAAHQAIDITHGHDPPYSRSLPSRAPPAFLS